jgi:hypothetical protein
MIFPFNLRLQKTDFPRATYSEGGSDSSLVINSLHQADTGCMVTPPGLPLPIRTVLE